MGNPAQQFAMLMRDMIINGQMDDDLLRKRQRQDTDDTDKVQERDEVPHDPSHGPSGVSDAKVESVTVENDNRELAHITNDVDVSSQNSHERDSLPERREGFEDFALAKDFLQQ